MWLQWLLSVVFALMLAALIGMALERMFLRPMIGEALFAVAIVTLGIDIIVRTITNDFIGQTSRPMGDPFGSRLSGSAVPTAVSLGRWISSNCAPFAFPGRRCFR